MSNESEMFRCLHSWFDSAQGLEIAELFNQELLAMNHILRGETLVQLGSCGLNSWLPILRYLHKWVSTPFFIPDVSTSVTSIRQLPFDRGSIDCILAPLTLDAFAHHEAMIDEIDRVLKSMGYIVFFGVNPISLWGMWLRFATQNAFGYKAYPHSPFFTERSLRRRGYNICSLKNFYYVPPVKSARLLNYLEIFNTVGKMISPCPSGFYCLVVQKMEKNRIPMEPILVKTPLGVPIFSR